MFTIASDEDFVQHIHTIQTRQGLGLLPDLKVGSFLDNVTNFYTWQHKVGWWVKASKEGQDAIFVAADVYEQCDCYNCMEKGSTVKGHICHNALFNKSNIILVALSKDVDMEDVVGMAVVVWVITGLDLETLLQLK
eukprot:4104436-Ditylum_brightwellii.AAC.1